MSSILATDEAVEVLTPPGRGAVAVVRCRASLKVLDGSEDKLPLCRARDGRTFAGRSVNRIVFARWGAAHPEDVVVCRTGDDEFEVHCHGGRAAVERVRRELRLVADAASVCGATLAASPTEVLVAAAWEAVSRATTLRTADLLLHQAAEAWPSALQASGRRKPADGDISPATHQGADAPRSPEMRAWAAEAMRWANFGRHLTEPWTVAIVGKPNAGKSSLMNALAGFQRSIVNPTPGTTRDAVTLDVAFDGWPVRLVDTAGLRESPDELEAIGVERARRTITEADLVLQLFDVTEPRPVMIENAVLVANKVDLLVDAAVATAGLWGAVSAKTGIGTDRLIEAIIETLVPELPPRDLAIPVCEEHERWLHPQMAS